LPAILGAVRRGGFDFLPAPISYLCQKSGAVFVPGLPFLDLLGHGFPFSLGAVGAY
jgi:hypothetical protein